MLLSKTIVFESMLVSLYVCLDVCLFGCLFVTFENSVFESMLVVLFVCLSVCLSVCLFVYPLAVTVFNASPKYFMWLFVKVNPRGLLFSGKIGSRSRSGSQQRSKSHFCS